MNTRTPQKRLEDIVREWMNEVIYDRPHISYRQMSLFALSALLESIGAPEGDESAIRDIARQMGVWDQVVQPTTGGGE